jgi:hypothetical protein
LLIAVVLSAFLGHSIEAIAIWKASDVERLHWWSQG